MRFQGLPAQEHQTIRSNQSTLGIFWWSVLNTPYGLKHHNRASASSLLGSYGQGHRQQALRMEFGWPEAAGHFPVTRLETGMIVIIERAPP